MDSLFNQDSSSVLILGAGALGCIAAKWGGERADESGAAWSAAHVDSAELIATGLDRKLFLKVGGGPSASNGLSRSIDDNDAIIERIARGRDSVVVCGELSDSRAIHLIGALSEALNDRGIAVFALVIEPFSMGGYDSETLESHRDHLAARAPFVALLNSGMETTSAGVALKRIRTMAADRLARAAECLALALDSAAACASRLKTFRGIYRASFEHAGAESVGASTAKTTSAIAACDRAIAALDDVSRTRIAMAVVSSASEISFRDSRAIAQKLPSGSTLIATANAALEGRAECLMLSREVKSANVVSIDSLRNQAGVKAALHSF